MEKLFSKKLNSIGGHSLALVAIIIIAFGAVYFKLQKDEVTQTLKNGYDRSFYELIEYMNNVETLLAKAQITNTPEYSAKTLTDIWREANLAQSSLSQIPLSNDLQGNSLKFLNQVSDYAYSLSRKTIEDKELLAEDFENLKILYDNCKSLNETLKDISSGMQSGDVSWMDLTKEENNAIFAQEVSNLSREGFGNLQKNLQDYEGLIYDGPFSEHITNKEPKGLGEKQYTDEMAREIIYEYIDKNKIVDIKYNGLVEGNIKSHSYDISLNNNNMIYIDITEQGGQVLFMNYNREVNGEILSIEEASKKASSFLEGHGFKNMKESYYINQNGMLTINYAYTQNGVVCYSDLIKVKVALDNGEITGMECNGYLTSHYYREFSEPKITMDEAREKINPKMKINYEGLALTPTDWGTEVLTYEFKGKTDDNDFIVYINADTGREENIFMIIDTPNGVLAI